MSTKPTPKRPWSLRRKLLLGGLIALVVLALALGLGLGLTLGGSDDNGDDTDSPTLTPLPSPNTTLTWTPKVGDTWQIVLSHPPAVSSSPTTTPNVTIFDVDLFDTPKATIDSLHALGKKVICYFSAGSYEEWRSDAKDFKSEDLGKELDGWPGEKWVRLGSQNLRGIMKKRIELAKEKGCDGVDPDNVDGYQNDNGLSLTANDSIALMQYLSSVTRPLNMSLGLKNSGSIISAVLPLVDFSVNEQCVEYNECSKFAAFIDAGKPVFHIEYPADDGNLQQSVESNGFSEDIRKKFCNGDGTTRFSTVLKKMELDGWVEYCDGRVEVTGTDQGIGGHGKQDRAR